MSKPIELGTRRELFVDHFLIEKMENTGLKLHPPRVANTAIRIDKPWEGAFNGGCCVIQDGGLFRMYYRGLKPNGLVYLCYAESTDGIEWTKPNLRLFEVMGTRDNNVIAPDTPNYDLFLDTRPGIPDEERYKMTRYSVAGKRLSPYFAGSGVKMVHLFTSGDGLRFEPAGDEPMLTCDWPNAFDSHNIFFWSEVEQQYVCYFRYMDDYRTMGRITSPDLRIWADPESMTYGDTPREELYTNSTMPYPRAPHIYLALPARFMPGRRVVTEAQLSDMNVATAGEHVYYEDCSEGVFMTTRAGTAVYDRTFMEGYVRPGIGPNNWVSRTNYPLHGVVQTGKDELSFYVSRHYAQPTWHIRRYVLRLDGFSSINASYAGGSWTSRVCTFSGSALEINYATGAAGHIRVGLQDHSGQPLIGYTLDDCDEIIGDETARLVTWRGQSGLVSINGEPVRLKFEMKDADVYGIRFKD